MSSNNHLIQISEFNYLPTEIWTQILENLPAKTLLKFRSLVALDSLGYLGNREIGYLLTHRHPETLRKTGLIFRNSDLYSYRMIGSCNGLILVSRIESPRSMQKKLRLWNPCIRKSLVIPDSPFSPSLHANVVYLFGYASVSKDYKVVALAKEKGVGQRTRKMYVAVYTLRDQRWTARHDWLNVGIPNAIEMSRPSYCLSAAVSLKGVAYWLGKVDKDRNELSHICSFDFNKEEISFVELPSSWDETGSCRFLFLLGKSLAIFRISKVASSIWVLDQDNKNGPWTQRFSEKSSQDGYELFRFFYLNQKLFFCESDGGYFIRGNKSYNIASCEVQDYKGFKGFNLQLELYSESLVLSKGYGACDLRVLT